MFWNLRFAGFEWKVNPAKINIDSKCVLSEYTSPDCAEVIGNIREGALKVSGEGEFVGMNCIYDYEALQELFRNKKRGLLTLPGMKPFYAYFTALSVSGDETPEVLRYKFEFVRDTKKSGKKKFHICKEGESLFDVADMYNVALMSLVKLNPQLKSADGLKKGERVALC